jgi:hypothetical protein
LLPVGAFGERGCAEMLVGHRLQLGRKSLPRSGVERGMQPDPDVVGHAAVFLHLIELGGVDQDQRVFLAVNEPGLQRTVHLAKN